MSDPEKKSPISAQDLYNLHLITDCQISPDGERVVFCVQRVDQENEKKYTNLWLVPTAGGEPRQFTHGDQVDSHPRWSPDGGQIAFLSNRGDADQPQIYLIPLGGGEARQLTDMKGEFNTFAWSPDGQQLVCQFQKKDQEAIEREQDEHKKELGVVARHITRIFFKVDGSGYLPQERWHLWTIDAQTGQARQLTDGPVHDEIEPAWSPDGRAIAFCSNRSPDPDLDPDVIDLFVIPAAGGEMRRIETPLGPKEKPSFSPDGKWIAYLGHEGCGQWWKNTHVWIVPADGSGEARNLTASFDVTVSSWTANDMPGHLPLLPPVWSQDGRRLYVQVTQHGNTFLQAVDVTDPDQGLETIVGENGVVGPFNFDRERTGLAYFHADMTDLGQVWMREVSRGTVGDPRPLTQVNTSLLQARDLGHFEEIWFKGSDGNDLQGWILKPPGFDPANQYPSILEIHGGPRVQYGNYFMHEFYTLAAHGYVVYFCNPRGGLGYGEEHAKSIVNNWGTADYEDLMAWADLVQALPYIDPDRMGVTGGSYGGYMTNWIIGHTDRFKAAVTQRCVSNLISMYGSSDFNWDIQSEFGDQPPWENFENYWRQSPLKYVGRVKTPTLVIHSEQDMRCAIEQGEQMFVALKRLGVETEMVRFPDEPHGLSRGGRTDRRIVRLHHILRWFDRYLKPDQDSG